MAGRTVSKWVRFLVDDSGGTPREIPIHTLDPVGLVYNAEEKTAYQDAVMGYLAGHPEAVIRVSGPYDTTAAGAAAASGAAPVLSGSHTILAPISAPTFVTPLGLAVMFGDRAYWATGAPVFGVVAPSATSGYVCVEYTTDGTNYTAEFRPYPGTTPAWGTAILT